jgi:hypothetical protein
MPTTRTVILNLKFGDAAVKVPFTYPWTFVVLTFIIDKMKVSRQFFKSVILEQPKFTIVVTAPEYACCNSRSTLEYYYQGEGSFVIDQRPEVDVLTVMLDSIGWYSTLGSRTWNDRAGWSNYKLINITAY